MSVYVLAVSIVLAVIALTVSIGIGAYFAYKYIKSNKEISRNMLIKKKLLHLFFYKQSKI